MFKIECPNCEKTALVPKEDLPDRACDIVTIECNTCGKEFDVGWYAEIELRLPSGSLCAG